MPRLHHFTDEQAQEIRDEIIYYLSPIVRRWLLVAIFVGLFLVLGAATGVWLYGRESTRLTEQVCRTSRDVRNPLQVYLATAIKIENEEKKINVKVFANPRLQPLIRQQDIALHKLVSQLRIADTKTCTVKVGS